MTVFGILGAAGVYGEVDGLPGAGVYGVGGGDSYTNYGIWGQSSSPGGYGVYGQATGSSGVNYGVYGSTSSSEGYAGYFEGDVGQRRTDDGLVKAAAKIDCSKGDSSVGYSFNNIGDPITVSGSPTLDGLCYIDFNFDLSDRYWTATAATTSAHGVSCTKGGSDDELVCHRWDKDGNGVDGNIMVVVY